MTIIEFMIGIIGITSIIILMDLKEIKRMLKDKTQPQKERKG